LEEEKIKKLKEYENQKSGFATASNKTMKSAFKEVENF
jgi:hypothetical protein